MKGNAVAENVKWVVVSAAASVVIIAGLFYIGSLRAELKQARQDSSAAQEQIQKLTVNLDHTQASLASASQAEEQLKAQLAESKANLESVSPDLSKEVEALKQKVSDLQTNIAYRNRVSAWWRDLFDYTKPFKGAEPKEIAG